MYTDWLIVGAGLTGSTLAERIASQRRESVLIIDQRDHIGGNVYDEYNEYGILTHKYGPHIFHTNSDEVFNYLSHFTSWCPYYHKVLASVEGQLVPIPFNLNTINKLFPTQMAARLGDKLITEYGYGARVPILKLREVEDTDLNFLADYIYRNVFESYTRKQWGVNPEDLSPAVTARVPVLASRDDRYFQDTYQAMPQYGYTNMIRRMLAQPNIRVMLNTNWQDVKEEIQYKRIIFTGPIDEFFNYSQGQLPYRSLNFNIQTHDQNKFQDAAVINYPNDYNYTRITEQKWLTGQKHTHTTTITEYPIPHISGKTIPYYPIPSEENRRLYGRYDDKAKEISDTVIFAGRLGNYQYYNMDQAVAQSLAIFRKLP
ncbi:UDP-galactopyranose mutase [Thalassospira mesophila]|uniref:UDP-galactopyranose mutase n=1 Tax=Thalassospira mesophila TaxID=1293891 RepID=A0A1Y2L3V6_9PROT|nr:UDP-galactopyranose mutase [Thalassospira mesophila]OSQ40497.1 UDP-galactopyranose mutase [Thalassospira mesophila]